MKKRLNYPEFHDLLNSYDIVYLQETKTDDIDTLNIAGYKLYMKNRSTLSKVPSGGIIFGVRENLSEHIEIIDTNSRFVLWAKISKRLHNLEKDIQFKFNSKYSSRDAFDELELELLDLNRNDNYILIKEILTAELGLNRTLTM